MQDMGVIVGVRKNRKVDAAVKELKKYYKNKNMKNKSLIKNKN